MVPPSPSRRALVAELDGYERLVEVGVGRRPGVARALAARGREVVAIDVDVTEPTRDAAAGASRDSGDGGLRVVAADVTELADAPIERTSNAFPSPPDAVYARNLPAELQRPTVALADRLDAACLFTALGFEEPVVPVRRRSTAAGVTVYVARGGDEAGRGPDAR